jgi:endonuclease/exonuclease/phosphatase family metal-dependent hydrolase
MSYAYFEVKATGEKFVLLNTHYESPGNNEAEKAEHLEYRNSQTENMVAKIAELEQVYNCPIVITGDFNTTEGNDKTGTHAPYWGLVEGAELQDAKHVADTIKRACSTWHEYGKPASTAKGGSFDHIFGTDRVHFTYFNTLVDKLVITASDHCPIYADIKLN